jgi:hypothetical protein
MKQARVALQHFFKLYDLGAMLGDLKVEILDLL